ncbi:MAG: hypothetical protein J1F11_11150 [Oscillospiraceae bacterium]|nr:hypothetical protein [Oscillospiraceae bacterium]
MSFNFDGLVSGAKDVFDKAAAKAGEAIDYSKNQIDRSQMRIKVKELYGKLGKICYDMHENGDDRTGEMKKVIGEIKELNDKLNEKDDSVNLKKTKECPFCETSNDAANAYCTKCGEKL